MKNTLLKFETIYECRLYIAILCQEMQQSYSKNQRIHLVFVVDFLLLKMFAK